MSRAQLADVLLRIVDRGIGSRDLGKQATVVPLVGGGLVGSIRTVHANDFWVQGIVTARDFRGGILGAYTNATGSGWGDIGAWKASAKSLTGELRDWIRVNRDRIVSASTVRPSPAIEESPNEEVIVSASRLRLVTAPPGAAVYVEGRAAGFTGLDGLVVDLVDQETHLRLEKAGYRSVVRTVRRAEAVADAEVPLTVALPEEGPSGPIVRLTRVRVLTNPPGVDIFIGPKYAGVTSTSGLSVDVPYGATIVSARKKGFRPAELQVDAPLASGEIRLRLEKE